MTRRTSWPSCRGLPRTPRGHDGRVRRSQPQWTLVDEGWGRKAVDFATSVSQPTAVSTSRLHHLLAVDRGDDLLDVACGSGLALELARLRGATIAGIDASERLVAVARDRNPEGDIRVGDMRALPWPDATFDVVTSFRGVWGTTQDVMSRARARAPPGGRLGLTVWGHIKVSPGAWALAPFRLAAHRRSTIRPRWSSSDVRAPVRNCCRATASSTCSGSRWSTAWEYADPEVYRAGARIDGALVRGDPERRRSGVLDEAIRVATDHVRDGLPLRAEIDIIGYLARKPN